MKAGIRVCKLLTEVTSLLLAAIGYIYSLSGYGLIRSEHVKMLTFGLLDYKTSLDIHMSPIIRLTLLFLAIVHGVTGFMLLAQKIRNSLIRCLCKLIIMILGIAVAIQFLLLEMWF